MAMKELLNTHYPFRNHLSEEEQQVFVACFAIQEYKRGNPLQDKHHHCLGIFLVQSGQMRAYIQSGEGREVTLSRTNPNEICILSAGCVIEEVSFEVVMEAIEDSVLLIFGTPCLRRPMGSNPYVKSHIYKHIAKHLSDVMWAISEILFESSDKRLTGYLGDEKPNRKSATIQTTRDEIAKELGSAREAVSRILKYSEKEGTVSFSQGIIQITNEAELRALTL